LGSRATPSLLEVETSDEGRVLGVQGELCLSTIEVLREPLFAGIDTAPGNIVVDLTECTFIDSSGLELLALASWRLAATDPRLELVVVSPRSAVRRILDLTGMDHIVSIRDTRPDAEASMHSEGAGTLAQSLARS
jgi:anti-sigma B factor antagonist